MKLKPLYYPLVSFCILLVMPSLAQEMPTENKWKLSYGTKGLEVSSKDENYTLQVQGRLQFRFSTPFDSEPVNPEEFNNDEASSFNVNRARLKIGGNAYRPWLKYYWEYELGQSNLMDFRLMVEKWEWLNIKAGQWKVEFSRERRISSGEQQMMDRSIINRAFTLDRQQGVELYGRLRDKGAFDFSYWMAVLSGTGRGNRSNDDEHLMYFGRIQWNIFNDVMDFKSSDVDFKKSPAAIIALAAVTNRSPYTRFSSSGGGSLEGFDGDGIGEYRVEQMNLETAFAWNGFAWQSEYHWKAITDKLLNMPDSKLRGYYLQAGYLPAAKISWFPKPLEVAARYARYMPNTEFKQTFETEKSLALNWFFEEHKNKLTLEITQLNYEIEGGDSERDFRFRLQWDISF